MSTDEVEMFAVAKLVGGKQLGQFAVIVPVVTSAGPASPQPSPAPALETNSLPEESKILNDASPQYEPPQLNTVVISSPVATSNSTDEEKPDDNV